MQEANRSGDNYDPAMAQRGFEVHRVGALCPNPPTASNPVHPRKRTIAGAPGRAYTGRARGCLPPFLRLQSLHTIRQFAALVFPPSRVLARCGPSFCLRGRASVEGVEEVGTAFVDGVFEIAFNRFPAMRRIRNVVVGEDDGQPDVCD